MAQNPESNLPNWPKKPDYTSPLPKSTDGGKIPPRKQIHAANGLPHSPSPRPLGDIKSK